MSHTGVEFYAAAPTSAMTEAWLSSLLRSFWAHGAIYSQPDTSPRTWDAELRAPLGHLTASIGATNFTGALADFIAQAADKGMGRLDYSVADIPLTFAFHARPWKDDPATAQVGWLTLTVQRVVISPVRANLVEAERFDYLTAYRMFLRQCMLLCEGAAPLYGFGYFAGLGFSAEDRVNERGLMVYKDETNHLAEALIAGQAPHLTPYFPQPPYEYAPASLLTPERLSSLLAQPGMSVQRLATGGVFIEPQTLPFREDVALGYVWLHRGKAATEQARESVNRLREGSSPGENAETATVMRSGWLALQRALGIFRSAGEQDGAAHTQSELERLLALAGRVGLDISNTGASRA